MKVFAAAARSESGDDYLFVSLCKDDIAEQILEVARHEYGPESENSYYAEYYADDYLDYDHYLLSRYHTTVEGEFDL